MNAATLNVLYREGGRETTRSVRLEIGERSLNWTQPDGRSREIPTVEIEVGMNALVLRTDEARALAALLTIQARAIERAERRRRREAKP